MLNNKFESSVNKVNSDKHPKLLVFSLVLLMVILAVWMGYSLINSSNTNQDGSKKATEENIVEFFPLYTPIEADKIVDRKITKLKDPEATQYSVSYDSAYTAEDYYQIYLLFFKDAGFEIRDQEAPTQSSPRGYVMGINELGDTLTVTSKSIENGANVLVEYLDKQ